MGIVQKLQINSINEVTGALILKGNRERVKRHCSSLIPLLSVTEYNPSVPEADNTPKINNGVLQKSNKRLAAIDSQNKTRNMIMDGSV